MSATRNIIEEIRQVTDPAAQNMARYLTGAHALRIGSPLERRRAPGASCLSNAA